MRLLALCLLTFFHPSWSFAQLSTELILPEGHTGGQLDNITFSSNGRYAASGNGVEIITWDLASGSSLIRTPATQRFGELLGFTPDNEFIIVQHEGLIYEKGIINLNTRRQYFLPIMDKGDTVNIDNNSAVLNPINQQLIAIGKYPNRKAGDDRRYIAIWDTSTGKLLRTIERLPYLDNFLLVKNLEISGDGSTLLMWFVDNASQDRISVIDLKTFARISNLSLTDFSQLKGEVIRSVHLSLDGKQVIGCTLSISNISSQILIWNSRTGAIDKRLKRNGTTSDICYTNSGKSIALVGQDPTYKQPPAESNALWTYDLPELTNVKIYKTRGVQMGPMRLNVNKSLVTSVSLPGDITFWNPSTGVPVRTLRSRSRVPTSMISGKDNTLYVGYRTSLDTRISQSGAFQWNLADPEASHRMNLPLGSGDPFLSSDSARTVLVMSQADRLTQQNLKDGSNFDLRVSNLKLGEIAYFRDVSLSPSGKSIAALHFRYPSSKQDIANIANEPIYVTVWSKNGTVRWSQSVGYNMKHITTLFFSANEQTLYVKRDRADSTGVKADILSFDVSTGKLIKTQSERGEWEADQYRTLSQNDLLNLLTNGQAGSKNINALQSMYAGRGDVAIDYNLGNMLLMSVSEYTDFTKPVFPLSNRRMPLTQEGNEHGDPCLIDPLKQRIIYRLSGHSLPATSAKFVTKDLLATSSHDKTIRLWKRQDGCLIATLFMLNEEDWIIVTPDNYYMANRSAARNLFFKIGGQVISFDQFDLRFNRPDIVLERIGLSTSQLIDEYRRAYMKRILKLGFSEQQIRQPTYSLPVLRVLNKNIPTVTQSKTLSLQVEATDSQVLLDRILIYINDVPIDGQKGINLKPALTKSTLQNLTIPLSSGRNKIQISAFNQQGLESYRELHEVFCEASPKSNKIHLIAIGVSNYADKTQRLKYAAKDAQDVAALFEKRFKDTQQGSVTLLIDEQVTKEALKSLRLQLMQTGIDDKVIVFFAGHGVLDLSTRQWYYAPHDANFSNPSVNGIAYSELEELMDGIPARNKLLMLDACFSGETDEEQNNILANTKQLDKGVIFRGLKNNFINSSVQSNGTTIGSAFNTMKRLFSELRRNSGTTVIAAASGGEFAIENEKYRNGTFTYALRNALDSSAADSDKNGKISVSELQRYIHQLVQKLTNNQQTPTSRQENLELDFTIW